MRVFVRKDKEENFNYMYNMVACILKLIIKQVLSAGLFVVQSTVVSAAAVLAVGFWYRKERSSEFRMPDVRMDVFMSLVG
jgi:hypothetical protein